MIEPSINSLMKNVDSRFTLVVATAKRARQLTDGAPKLVETDADKPVTIAIEEIKENKISYIRTKNGINLFAETILPNPIFINFIVYLLILCFVLVLSFFRFHFLLQLLFLLFLNHLPLNLLCLSLCSFPG
jgi:DNA-directed RNA polymerase subunit omega